MINYGQIEESAVIGYAETLEFFLVFKEFTEESDYGDKFPVLFDDEEYVAEALYCCALGLSNK